MYTLLLLTITSLNAPRLSLLISPQRRRLCFFSLLDTNNCKSSAPVEVGLWLGFITPWHYGNRLRQTMMELTMGHTKGPPLGEPACPSACWEKREEQEQMLWSNRCLLARVQPRDQRGTFKGSTLQEKKKDDQWAFKEIQLLCSSPINQSGFFFFFWGRNGGDKRTFVSEG